MGIHGVDESEMIKLSNMEFLYDQTKKAEKIFTY
jgi:hypothetical protein